jgi:hypothetical protein
MALNWIGHSSRLKQQTYWSRNTGFFAKTMVLVLAEIPIVSRFVNLRVWSD